MKRGPGKPPKSALVQARAQAQRAALNALRRARRAAARTGVALSDWEGEFLGSVEDRLKTYGRAFADPDKAGAGGAIGGALSALQAVKLKQITQKAKGEDDKSPRRPRKGFQRRVKPQDD